jgi:hypothetical protein
MHSVQSNLIASRPTNLAVEEIHTTVVIEAPAFVVWNILTDFPTYPEWNPFILKISGELKINSRLAMEIKFANAKVVPSEFVVMGAEVEREITWGGKNGGNLFGVEHRLAIQPLARNRVTFLQTARFGGDIVSLVARNLHLLLEKQFEGMNAALKARAEESWKASPSGNNGSG